LVTKYIFKHFLNTQYLKSLRAASVKPAPVDVDGIDQCWMPVDVDGIDGTFALELGF
jgi:hypothetical protein